MGTRAADVTQPPLGEEAAATSTAPTVPEQPVDGLLYVAEAGAAVVDGDGAEVTVSLTETDAEVLWFQDRPGRGAGELRMAALVDQWASLGFANDPPKAVIRHDGDPAGSLGTVVEMRDPTWDQPTGTFRFTAVLATGETALPPLMSDVALFIDDGGSCSGTALHQVDLALSDVQPGQQVTVSVAPGQGSWSSGQAGSGDAEVALTSSSGAVPVESFTVGDSDIVLKTAAAGGGAALSVQLTVFLAAPSGAELVQLTSTADPGVEITASIAGAAAQVVGPSATTFSLDAG